MKKTDRKRSQNRSRTVALLSAFLCALLCAITVYGAVSYDSSKDPVVAQSFMEQYVGEQLAAVNRTIESLSSRVSLVELTGGGGAGGGEGGMSSAAAQQLLGRIDTLEQSLNALETENAALRDQLEASRNELQSLVMELYNNDVTIKETLNVLSEEIANVNAQAKTNKSDIATLKNDFKQISDISTKLARVTYLVDQLTKDGGDVPVLQDEVSALKTAYQNMLEEMGQTYKVVEIPAGCTIRAKEEEDTLLVILRSGAASVVSPYNAEGLRQCINDLTDGVELYDGATLPIYHSVLIPRGGKDGRCIRIDGVDNAFVMVGGDYVIES